MRRHCQHCQQMYVAERRKRKYCSRQCAADARPRESFQASGRKGMAIRYPNRIAEMRERYQTLSAGMTPWQAFQAGAKWQRRREYNRIYRVGYAAGWEGCAKAVGWRQIRREA